MKVHASLIRIDTRENQDVIEYAVMVPEDGNEVGREIGLIRLDSASDEWVAVVSDETELGRFDLPLEAVRALIANT